MRLIIEGKTNRDDVMVNTAKVTLPSGNVYTIDRDCTEYTIDRQYMYRYADDMKDTHGYHNRWATSLEELVNGITELLLFPVSEVKDCRI